MVGIIVHPADIQDRDGHHKLLNLSASMPLAAPPLVSSTVLLLAANEPLRDLKSGMSGPERHFRLVFVGGYEMLLAVSVVWATGAAAGSLTAQWTSAIKVACAVVALISAGLAIRYRNHHPMPDLAAVRRRPATPHDDVMAERILELMTGHAAYAESDLKVADLARRLNEAEYKVTQCITGPLAFRNFNHMVNHFRIEQASRSLADRRYDHLPVLTIALDCGFGSIGPFNRAFKARFGDTPTTYRERKRSTQRVS